MSTTVIKVENLSKQYRLGLVGTGTLAHDLNRWWALLRGKEDPYLKIGEVNRRNESSGSTANEYVWALKDINFEVKQGEVLGIIGKNGAGKSTLLKILSRVTGPTTGSFKAKGRIASLLEVGTGFHPELTGKENIFLNGAILGMTKTEIRSKIDEIIAFSGVERYIDTPVKRYSSGMYVRLAFAVAAHLDPEILIIDEVLAVGDAEFQKKCLGKMKDVAGEGRTVLFVSHNMTAVNTLCGRCVYLKDGKIEAIDSAEKIISEYLASGSSSKTERVWNNGKCPGDDVAVLKSARIIDEDCNTINIIEIDKKVGIEYVYEILIGGSMPIPNIHVYTDKNERAFASNEDSHESLGTVGVHKSIAWIPANLLNTGTYIVGIALSTLGPVKVHFHEREALFIEVVENMDRRKNEHRKKIPGVVRPLLEWTSKQIV